jgi:hypothetical protein
MDIDELEKFMNYAKVANPTYNSAEHFLCVINRLRWLERRMGDLQGELEYLREDDEDYKN